MIIEVYSAGHASQVMPHIMSDIGNGSARIPARQLAQSGHEPTGVGAEGPGSASTRHAWPGTSYLIACTTPHLSPCFEHAPAPPPQDCCCEICVSLQSRMSMLIVSIHNLHEWCLSLHLLLPGVICHACCSHHHLQTAALRSWGIMGLAFQSIAICTREIACFVGMFLCMGICGGYAWHGQITAHAVRHLSPES